METYDRDKENQRLDKLENDAYTHPNTWVIISDTIRIRFIPHQGLECQWHNLTFQRGF